MHKFMDPASVALIGTPRRTGAGAFNNAEMMLRYGFRGRIYPVNPAGGEILGLKVYSAVSEIPEAVDLAVISVGRDRPPSRTASGRGSSESSSSARALPMPTSGGAGCRIKSPAGHARQGSA
jgi:hypothetical protein